MTNRNCVVVVVVIVIVVGKVCAGVWGSLTGRHYCLHATGVSKVRLVSKFRLTSYSRVLKSCVRSR